MSVRISFCRNAGANRGKVVASVVIKDDSSSFDNAQRIARNKLRIPKKKPINFHEHFGGTPITEENWKQVVSNGTILNVACGEAFISPQGIVFNENNLSEVSDVPPPPRWPTPFGNSALDKTVAQAPPRIPARPVKDVVYVDLDGVLADFDLGIANLCGGLSPEQMSSRSMWKAISDAEDFFGSLSWKEHGQDLFDAIQTMFQEDQIEILSAGQGKFSDQKKRWCEKHLGRIKVNVCESSREKPRWSREGCILIDDNLDLKLPWEKRGGRFVHYTGTNLKETLIALQQLCSDQKLPALETVTRKNFWPSKRVEFVALDVNPVYYEEILEYLPTEVKKRIDKKAAPLENLHVTLAHMKQLSQQQMRKTFGGMNGEKVEVEVRGLLWSNSIAALHVSNAEKSLGGTQIPRPLNRFTHITIWHRDGTKPSSANDLPRQVQCGDAREIHFAPALNLVCTLTYATANTTQSLGCCRSPFADLSGDVLNYFKRLSRTNRYIQLRRYDEHISVDYTDVAAFQTGDAADPRLKECRGLLLSPIDGSVLARRFHKFYNVHEVFESDYGSKDIGVSGCLLMEKLDGFLVSPFVSPVSGRLQWATRQEASPAVERFVAATPSCDFTSFSKYWIDQRFTPLFECIIRNQHKGVVAYDHDRMVLLAIRHMDTGLYLDWGEVVSSAKQFKVPTARTISLPAGTAQTFEEILAFVRNNLTVREEMEGVVMVLADGQRRYKIKTNWYLNSMKLHLRKPPRLSESSAVDPPLLTWDGLQFSHWSEIPNQLLWELALWKWFYDESINDDLFPDYLRRLNLSSNFPIDILLYFVETIQSSVIQLDQDLSAWASTEVVQRNQGPALSQALSIGWDTKLVQSYLAVSENVENSMRSLVSFLWNKIIKKSEWDALQRLLCIDFVRLSDLSTDVGRLLQTVFDRDASQDDETTIILRGLPGSGKSYFSRQVLAPYFAPTSVEICSADDFFATNRKYEHDESMLGAAHADCRQRFLKSTATIRIVDNTHSTLQEYAFYKRKSPQSIVVFEIHGRPCTNRTTTNDHNVPQVVINRMRRRWEDDPDVIHVQNFHHC